MWQSLWHKAKKFFGADDDQYEDREDMLQKLEKRLQEALEEEDQEQVEHTSSTNQLQENKKDVPKLISRLHQIKENCRETIDSIQLENSLELEEIVEDGVEDEIVSENQTTELLTEQKEETKLKHLDRV